MHSSVNFILMSVPLSFTICYLCPGAKLWHQNNHYFTGDRSASLSTIRNCHTLIRYCRVILLHCLYCIHYVYLIKITDYRTIRNTRWQNPIKYKLTKTILQFNTNYQLATSWTRWNIKIWKFIHIWLFNYSAHPFYLLHLCLCRCSPRCSLCRRKSASSALWLPVWCRGCWVKV